MKRDYQMATGFDQTVPTRCVHLIVWDLLGPIADVERRILFSVEVIVCVHGSVIVWNMLLMVHKSNGGCRAGSWVVVCSDS